MGVKAFLSAAEKADLMRWIAAKGENYDRYIDWCVQNRIPEHKRFTQNYLHRWIARRRRQIQVLRAEHQAGVRKASLLDKEQRVAILEEQVARIRRALDEAETVDQMVKLEEALGRALDRIARERGEFGKPAPDADPSRELNRSLAEIALRALEKAGPAPAPQLAEPVIEGEYEERG
jgi:hypothetical protein